MIALLVPEARAQDELAEGKRHYEQALRHYDLNEFDKAIAEFTAAYVITHEPALLYNIAQAYRLKGDRQHALEFYRSYLRRAPDAPNKADVDKWIRELERPPPRKSPLRLAGLITAGAGLLLTGGGVYFLLSARQTWGDIQDAADQQRPWTEHEDDLWDQAESDELKAQVLLGAGAVSVAAGATLYLLGWRADEREAARVAAVPTAGGAIVSVTCDF
jgi:tetratricopeptide (TPR) repeat protein